MRKLIRFTCGNILVLIISITLLVYFGAKLRDGFPGAIILVAIVFSAWILYMVISMVRLLGIK